MGIFLKSLAGLACRRVLLHGTPARLLRRCCLRIPTGLRGCHLLLLTACAGACLAAVARLSIPRRHAACGALLVLGGRGLDHADLAAGPACARYASLASTAAPRCCTPAAQLAAGRDGAAQGARQTGHRDGPGGRR